MKRLSLSINKHVRNCNFGARERNFREAERDISEDNYIIKQESVFLPRDDNRLIVAPRKFNILKTNIGPRSEASNDHLTCCF